MRLLLFAALPRELKKLVGSFEQVNRLRRFPFRAFSCRHFSHKIMLCETGVGIGPAERTFKEVFAHADPEAVLAVGYCGALTEETGVGDLIWGSRLGLVRNGTVETVILPDPRGLLPELSSRVPVNAGTILTLGQWTKKADIARLLPQPISRPVCDMETFMLARLSLEKGVPFFALRSVSDGAHQDLRFHPAAVCDSSGTYRPTRALRFFLLNPHLMHHAIQLGRQSGTASHNLVRAVNALLRIL